MKMTHLPKEEDFQTPFDNAEVILAKLACMNDIDLKHPTIFAVDGLANQSTESF